MQSQSVAVAESPTLIRQRATALVEYLLAARAQIERPARTVPTAYAFWPEKLPTHPGCEIGPVGDGPSWLRVAHPAPLAPLHIPAELAGHLVGEPVYHSEPKLVADLAVGAPGADEAASPAGDADTATAADAETSRAADAPAITPELRQRFVRWRDEQWAPWAERAGATEAVRRLHRRLFELKHRLDMNAAADEFVWGHGLLHLEIDGIRVHYPLLITPVAVEFDPERSLVIVTPQGPTRLQVEALAGIEERYLTQLVALAGAGGQLDLDVWDDTARRALLERALRRLGQDPVLRAAAEPDPGVPHVHDTSVLFLRPRQRMLRRFLEELRGRLLGDEAAGVGALAALLAHEPSRLRMPDDAPERWAGTAERVLMPLPTNDAQESIARRLAQHRNVVVQGPPGTGKTHTIRNLICHLMAHGKRVLVVAQKEDPLRVLRDGLPAEIRSLCLAVLGRSTDQLNQLQLAARELSDRGATLDRRAEQTRVGRLRRQLEEAERELGRTLGALRTIAANEANRLELDGLRLSVVDVGNWLRERAAAYGDIPDAVPADSAPPCTAEEFGVLLDLARRTRAADREQALLRLPTVADLPVAATLRADRDRLAAARAELAELEAAGVKLLEVRALGAQPLTELIARLRQASALLEQRVGAWTDRLATLLAADPNWQHIWRDHVSGCQRALAELTEAARMIAGHRVEITDEHRAEPRRTLDQLTELRTRFTSGKGVNRIFHGGLMKIATDCRIDGETLRRAEDVDVVIAAVNRDRLRRELVNRWSEWAQRLGFPLPEPVDEPELWAGRLLSEAATALDWDRQRWPELHAAVRRLIPRLEPTIDVTRLRALVELVSRCATVFDHDQMAAADRVLNAKLQGGMSSADASVLWRLLDAARQDPELAGWDDHLAEVRRLAALRPEAQRFNQLHAKVAAVAPEWAAAIADGTAPALAGTGADCLERWRWRRTQTWFETVVGSVDPAGLSRRAEQIRDRIRRLTRELVVASAWLEVSKSLDDRRRAALADWSTALRKIGKGTGRNAAHWQAHAQRAMLLARDAVPVWVMSVDRAIEQFSGGADFDVVIVDEASQADLFALPVLSLARRAVVVGDDQQIGPQLPFVGDVTALIRAHLADVPSAEHFDPETSLYDHAVRRSPERILLTEHFRCVPAIINFSSDTYYGGEIEPLRTDRPQGIGAPVVAVHVPEGTRQHLTGFGEVNVAEADALVARVAAIVADPAYAGKSIGVVSLLSTSGQALYLLDRLRETIGAEEMERRQLRVGDPYTFQGDERDVVLISLVVSADRGPVAAFTKRDHHRRVNVAASRARDQLWVFHSVQPEELRADDARALLLTYCRTVTTGGEQTGELAQACESDFEREVLRRMLRRGYRPLPQFRIGSYRIDFVLPAPDGRRLAIECDGDAWHGPDRWESDLRRQAILERVGNCVFVRIRGSVFSRDPEAALVPLWQRIAELGIRSDREPVEPVAPVESVAAAGSVQPVVAADPVAPEGPVEVVQPTDSTDPAVPIASEGATDPVAEDAPPAAIEMLIEPAAEEPRPSGGGEPTVVVRPSGGDEPTVVVRASGPTEGAEATVVLPAPTGEATVVLTRVADAPAEEEPEPAETLPVPVGYRDVAWLRPWEALAALDSHRHCKDVPIRHERRIHGWARYYDSDSPEARRHRANIMIERAYATGTRVVCWLRPHEAKAVLRAADAKRSMPVLDSKGREVGLVEYFPPSSPAAIRFRSVTRLLRMTRQPVPPSTSGAEGAEATVRFAVPPPLSPTGTMQR
jgi:very-short-patch-repair endonuclease